MKKIRNSKASKVVAMYLVLMFLLEILAPMQAYALTGGPSQPEFNSFTPIDTSDMVDLASGDFNYNIPVMDVGGYPLNLAYNSGITMDQEASWVGLGWDLNVGQINRQMRGIPDDFDGDEMIYENNMKDNVTIGGNVSSFFALAAFNEKGEAVKPKSDSVQTSIGLNLGIGVEYNNYTGYNSTLSAGLSFQYQKSVSVGFNMSSSVNDGVSISPNLSFSSRHKSKKFEDQQLSLDIGVSLNSRKGLQALTLGATNNSYIPKDKSSINKESFSGKGFGGSITFTDASFTPTKRVGMVSSNFAFNMNLQGEFFFNEPGVKFTGYKAVQGIKDSEKYKREKAYGYENTYNATDKDILDFNREKERTIGVFTTTIPVTNQTYDIYNIKGQGIGGTFRPYKGQVDYVYDNHTEDNSQAASLGLELGTGGGAHIGIEGDIMNGYSSTKVWRGSNPAIARFEEKRTGNRPDYERVYFKTIGGFHVDEELNLLQQKVGEYDPVKIQLTGKNYSVETTSSFSKKNFPFNTTTTIPITGPIKREKRVNRNQSIEKLTRKEAIRYGFKTKFSPYSLPGKHDHHTSEIRVVKDGGERYIYGRAAYNVIKKEVTFDVKNRPANCHTGLVDYEGTDNSINNSRGGDNYFNSVTTPAYAHTYLLTSVLSSDYSDLTNDGPSDDDLGSYTKFVYNDTKTNSSTYKWRIPFDKNKANYDEGLKTSTNDNRGNYLYGEKELIYIDSIITKTHVAVFKISPRKDGYGVDGEDGGGDASTSSRMYKLDKILLYSKAELEANKENAIPIKVAHFVYDYSLCPDVPNNFTSSLHANELNNQGGKLTLKKIYFTYRNSNMGEYTPYWFNYESLNPSYDIKAYDTWGNYKPNPENSGCSVNSALTNAEFPFVEQADSAIINSYSSAWHLTSIELPSGGKINIEYESDSYGFVQDKEVMQMFKVMGAGTEIVPSSIAQLNNVLFQQTTDADRLYIQLPHEMLTDAFIQNCIGRLANEPIYFRFLLNMAEPSSGHGERYDYVTGYFELDAESEFKVFTFDNINYYASVPISTVNRGDGMDPNQQVNPISKAGWNFGSKYLNRFVYTNPGDESTDDLEEIVLNLVGTIPNMVNIFKSPNQQLIDKGIASRFKPGKSWIRLMHPSKEKLGGGSRVKEIKMYDNWDDMTNHPDDEAYSQYYGQQYFYETNNGITSGVATYEPLGNKENPFVQPFYGDMRNLQAPQEENYIELPLGECFYPAPQVTYSRVVVQNLPRNQGTSEVKRHATGKVVTEFYTSFDFPTIEDFTDLTPKYKPAGALSQILNIHAVEHLNLSQGFVYHTNDMNGKMKRQHVYGEGQTSAISGVEYIYNEVLNQDSPIFNKNQGKLDNEVITIDSQGNILSKVVGVDYDVVNDFIENKTVSNKGGVGFNSEVIPFGPVVVPAFTPFPSIAYHESQMRSVATTKVIHTTGILREKRVFDAGSSIYTRNLAWDADTGEVLLTETINEFDDKYYSFSFPANWAYEGMRQAAKNVGIEWKLRRVPGSQNQFILDTAQYEADDFLSEGDEIWVAPDLTEVTEIETELDEFKAYVVNIAGNKFSLINEQGTYIRPQQLQDGSFKIFRSGYRNMATASMASITSMINPLLDETGTLRSSLPQNIFNTSVWSDYRIVNASAIEYSDVWASQCECNLPIMQYEDGELIFNYDGNYDNSRIAYNPYKYNVKGNWRPKISYAYLTGRNASSNPHPRQDGFYNDFTSYYMYNSQQKKWIPNIEEPNFPKWTYASEVTQYNPYGFELENKDALDRYSTALYGYNFKLPVAVGSNTKYSEIAFDGFEDYGYDNCNNENHFGFQNELEINNVEVSSQQAHSGTRSLKIAPQGKAGVDKRVVPCPPSSTNEE